MPITLKCSRGVGTNPLTMPMSDRRQQLLKLMQEGAKLHCWRGSSPHNWYLTHANAGSEDETHLDFFDGDWLRHFTEVEANSAKVIPNYLFGRDCGLPEKSTWRYSAEQHAKFEQAIAEQAQRVALFDSLLKPFAPNFEQLSEMAKAMLRTLKRGEPLPYVAELQEVIKELCGQGLLQFKQPWLLLSEEAKALRIPRGHTLKLSFAD